MARNFRRSHAAQPIADLNVTNLIDLGFMLLIIFMVATPLIQKEQTISVKLPIEAKSPQEKPDPAQRTETVTIDAKGEYYLGGQKITFRELQVQIAAFAKEPKPPTVRVATDKTAIADKFLQVIIELKKHELLKLDIATEADK